MKGFLLALAFAMAVSTAQAQSRASTLSGGLTYGTVQFNTLSPTVNEFKLNSGSHYSLFGEKRFGFFQLYLTAALSYLNTSGTAQYNYISPTNITYAANQVGFTLDSMGASLGVRFKFIENSFLRPYIEAGGEALYSQLSYNNSLKTPSVLALGSDYKTVDSFLDFAPYGEAGLETDLTPRVGIKIAGRYTHHITRSVETIRKQSLTYDSLIYLIGIYAKF